MGYTPDIVVTTWLGFDKTDPQHFLQEKTESAASQVFNNEMTNILPYTKKTSFKVTDAATIAQQNQKNSPQNWINNFGNNVKQKVEDTINDFNNTRQNVTQWYNQIKGLIRH